MKDVSITVDAGGLRKAHLARLIRALRQLGSLVFLCPSRLNSSFEMET